MPPVRLAVVIVLGLPLALTACGGSTTGIELSADPTVSAGNTSTGTPEIQTIDLTCTDGVVAAKVSNVNGNPTAVAVTWTPQDNQGADYVSYVVTLSSGDGHTSRQVAKTLYASDHSPDQFIFDFGTSQQTNLDATDDGVSGLTFPNALAGITGPWTATGAVNIDGTDTSACS